MVTEKILYRDSAEDCYIRVSPMGDDLPPPPRPTCRDDFEIAIICALPLEFDAVIAVLDGRWSGNGDPYGKVAHDQNTYTTGWIGQHNVVLALSSGTGKIHATSVTTSLSLSYGKVKLAFLVGICGAVPRTSTGIEVVLGDVIVSPQVVEYDFGRQYSDGLRLKEKLAHGFGQQSHNARRFVATMQTDHYRGLTVERTLGFLRAAQEKYPRQYQSLPSSEDKLFSSGYRHKHQTQAGCAICNRCKAPSDPVCDIALHSTCEELECSESQVIYRSRLADNDAQRKPMVHWGTIASGDTVMNCAINRDKIAETHNIIGFEMEGAAVCNTFPCIIVKGACYYADSHMSKKWQNYAAITAACVMKVLLSWYPRTDQGSRAVAFTHGQELKVVHAHCSGLLRQQQELPPQVPFRDLVCVNDALGETYTFSLTFVDSLEFFLTILKYKFKDAGVGKIERGEWLLQDRRTGHVLNLNRPWKAVVKHGQILDMSMIFKKRNILSTQCPWCGNENESDIQGQHIECIQCSRKYRRIEEVYDIVGVPDTEPQHQDKTPKVKTPVSRQTRSELPTSHPMSPDKRPSAEDEEDHIYLYSRVQMIDINFRIGRPADGRNEPRKRQIIVRPQDLEDMARLARELTKLHHFPEKDCLAALEEYYEDILRLTTTRPFSHLHLTERWPSWPGAPTDTEDHADTIPMIGMVIWEVERVLLNEGESFGSRHLRFKHPAPWTICSKCRKWALVGGDPFGWNILRPLIPVPFECNRTRCSICHDRRFTPRMEPGCRRP